MESVHFLDTWQLLMYVLAPIAFLIGLGRRIAYMSTRSGLKDLKDRYDYMTSNEVKVVLFFWYMIGLSIFLLLNTPFTETIKDKGSVWFAGRMFLAFLVGAMFALISRELINIRFVANLERRLDKLRNEPRKTKDGLPMRKLAEDEEDTYLEAHQIAEESNTGLHSADYDVWLCDATGEKRIEKYYSFLHAIQCRKCDNFTLKISREEVTHQPTPWQTGQLVRHYKCNVCGHRERKAIELSRLQHSTAGNPNAATEVH